MKLIAFLMVYGLVVLPGNITNTSSRYSAKEVLQKISDKLNQLKALRFKQRLELSYPSENYHYEGNANGYLEFSLEGSIIGVKSQFENDQMLTIFNGTEDFLCMKEEKSMRVNAAPDRRYFSAHTYFNNSFVALKNALPAVLADDSIPKSLSDTTIRNVDYFFVEFVLTKKTIDGLGDFSGVEQNRRFRYQILVDPHTFLPQQIIRRNTDGFIKVSYDEIEENPQQPAETSWYYSSYLGQYSIEEPDKTYLIETGKPAPQWALPMFGTSDSLSLHQLKGRVVLLEFWIVHCGYCQLAVPVLNNLKKKYAKKKFQLLTLNVQDTKETIEAFINRNKPEYAILCNGKSTAKDYGVNAFPTVVLIDKKGVILYVGALEEKKIEQLVNANL